MEISTRRAPAKAIDDWNDELARRKRGTSVPPCDCVIRPAVPSVVHYGSGGDVVVGRTAQLRAPEHPRETIVREAVHGRGGDDPETRRLGPTRSCRRDTTGASRSGERKQAVAAGRGLAGSCKSLKRIAEDELRSVGGAAHHRARVLTTRSARPYGARGPAATPMPPTSLHAAALRVRLERKQKAVRCTTSAAARVRHHDPRPRRRGLPGEVHGRDLRSAGRHDTARLRGDLREPAESRSRREPSDIRVVLDLARRCHGSPRGPGRSRSSRHRRRWWCARLFVITRARFRRADPALPRSYRAPPSGAPPDTQLQGERARRRHPVGGSTRVPAVRDYVGKIFGKLRPRTSIPTRSSHRRPPSRRTCSGTATRTKSSSSA